MDPLPHRPRGRGGGSPLTVSRLEQFLLGERRNHPAQVADLLVEGLDHLVGSGVALGFVEHLIQLT